MSQNNLFTLGEADATAENELDFFDKIEEIEVDHSMLGANVVESIGFWSRSFAEKIKYLNELKQFKETFWEKAKENSSHYFRESSVPGMSEERVSLRTDILRLVRETFNIEPPSEMADELAKSDFDFTNTSAILDLIMLHTNNGDSEGIERDQKLKTFSRFVYVNPERGQHKLSKNKITIHRAFYSSKCSIWKEYTIGYSSHEPARAWMDALEFFAKEQDISPQHTGQELFELFVHNHREEGGIYEKRENENSLILTSVKLLKNGNMDIHFKTNDIAQKFWDEWLMPAQER